MAEPKSLFGALRGAALTAGAATWDRLPVALRRKVLHATNARFLVGVVGLIRDEQDRLLLLEHRFRTPHRWGLPGGFIQSGESLSQGLEREIQEEIGLAIAPEPIAFDTELVQPGRYVAITLTARALGPLVLPAGHREIVGGAFFGRNDALPADLYPYHLALVRRWWGG